MAAPSSHSDNVRDTYAFQVLRLIFGEAAAFDFFRVSYTAPHSRIADNEIVERSGRDVDVA
jgi:hypothetical protein